MTWLDNSWMDNSTFLAEMAHFAWAYGIFLTLALLGVSERGIAKLFAVFVLYAACKEFWHDLTFEIPNDSLAGSALDFAFCMLGGCVALAVIWYQRHRQRYRRLNSPSFGHWCPKDGVPILYLYKPSEN